MNQINKFVKHSGLAHNLISQDLKDKAFEVTEKAQDHWVPSG